MNFLENLKTSYIIEIKKIEKSYYRKWSNGILECWGLSGSQGTSDNKKIIFPISFKDTSYLIFTSYVGEALATISVNSTSKTIDSCVVNTSHSTGSSHQYYAIGTWK